MPHSQVNHLHVFLDRPGSDTCALSSIKFIGSTVQTTGDLKDLGKKEEEHKH